MAPITTSSHRTTHTFNAIIMAYITIQIPPDAEPGVDTLTFQYQGQELEILVPQDAKVGDVLQIQVGNNDDVDDDDADVAGDVNGNNQNDSLDKPRSSLLDELEGVHEDNTNTSELVKPNTENSTKKEIADNSISTVSLGNNCVLKLLESTPDTKNEGDGTNAMVWPSGTVLAQALTCDAGMKYIQQVTSAFTAKEEAKQPLINCLELGSGLGVCGLALAHTLSRLNVDARVLLTDRGDSAVKLLNENIQKNKDIFTDDKSSVSVETKSLNWGQAIPTEKFRIILGSDLLYNTNESYNPLLTTLEYNLHPEGILILAVRWRKPDLEKRFFEKALTMGFTFVQWSEIFDTSEFRTRCPCGLSWNQYGDPECDTFKEYFYETMFTVLNGKKSLAEIKDCDMESMTEDEYTRFEESQIQIYIGQFTNEKTSGTKRSIDNIS